MYIFIPTCMYIHVSTASSSRPDTAKLPEFLSPSISVVHCVSTELM